MTLWTSVLEAIHSSVIDVMNELYPDDPLVLGMPVRRADWGWPLPGMGTGVPLLLNGFSVRLTHGSTSSRAELLFLEEGGAPLLFGEDPVKIWPLIQKHAQSQFQARGVQPEFLSPDRIDQSSGGTFAQAREGRIQRVIWIPFECKMKRFFFGLAIESPKDSPHTHDR